VFPKKSLLHLSLLSCLSLVGRRNKK
jgi:hypothetical protein